MSRSRQFGLASLALLAGYALSLGFSPCGWDGQPWPLGGEPGECGALTRGLSLLLALALGWGVPGLCLAVLSDARLVGTPLLARAMGAGISYVVVIGLLHALVAGAAPGRAAWLVLLAMPAFACLLRAAPETGASARAPAIAAAIMALLTMALWPKLAPEGLNGDGTEAYELARSLSAHPLPRWDLEAAEGPGRFGTPMVNPFVTHAYLVSTLMSVLGQGELAARLPIVCAAVLCASLAFGLGRNAGASGALYVAAMTALHLLWNAYYVGYEPAFSDLAEPGGTDLLMIALWMAGFVEATRGSYAWATAFFAAASGILYSAPLLATVAVVALGRGDPRAARLGWLWLGTLTILAAVAAVYGASQGLLPVWWARLYEEYWHDLAGTFRRTPSTLILGQLLLLTGALPVVAVVRVRRLDPASRALLMAAGVYLVLVLVHGYKNLHYLAPLPYLLAPPALAASGRRMRAGAIAILVAAFALSWPSHREVHRETIELGRLSCVTGLDYESAVLAADVVYDAFSRPDETVGSFAVGKHTFVRYALALGTPERCLFRLAAYSLAPYSEDGWTEVARGQAVFAVRDSEAHAAWRARVVPFPSSPLFPRAADPLPPP